MKKNVYKLKNLLLLLIIGVISLVSIAATSGDGRKNGGNKSLYKSNADFYVFNINNVRIPIDNKGILGAVDPGDGIGAGGTYNGTVFLFSGGFFLSGLHDGQIWSNGVMSASLVTDYQAGPVGTKALDPKHVMYVVSSQDPAFGEAWQNWADAVSLGADYYDGNGNGIYDPIDLNDNGIWEPTEDRPDLIGDITIWCVYNDGMAKALRRYTDVDPKGIEIHQSVYGFASKGVVGNMMFVRYRLINKGTVADKFDSVYFALTVDPDLGDANDDLVGCDTLLSCGYTYQNTADAEFGQTPPCFLVDFFQGPVSYIPGETFTDVNGNGVYDPGVDTPLDTAFNRKGKVLGIDTLPGARNLPLTSFTQYMQSHQTHGDPDTRLEVRNYLLGGRGKNGNPIDVCNWTFGNGGTLGNCADIDPKFMYSGDPVANLGWINTTPIDQRQMSNTGPFVLEKGKPIDIVGVYLIGVGATPALGVRVAKDYAKTAQLVFDNNFPAPPAPLPINPTIQTGEDWIDITFNTSNPVNYSEKDTVLDIDRRTQGFYITQYRTNSKVEAIEGLSNKYELIDYQLDNFVQNIYQKKGNGGVDLIRKISDNRIDPVKYGSTEKGRIRLRLEKDHFAADGPFIKGKEYYFTLTHYTLNHRTLQPKNSANYGDTDDYVDVSGGGFEEFETSIFRVVFGQDMFDPAVRGGGSEQDDGASDGEVRYIVANRAQLTGNNYSVEFFKDNSTQEYSTFWKLKNNTTGVTLIDSSKDYNFDTTDFSGKITEGFIVKVKSVTAELGTAKYSSTNQWYKPFDDLEGTGVFYVGQDLGSATAFPTALKYPSAKSTAIGVDDLRQIEIRFGTNGKAYRYINGVKGTVLSRNNSYVWAGAITPADTAGASIGKWNTVTDRAEGFVDVPFTAWVVDPRYNETRQLAVGFVERRYNASNYPKGNPDGVWNPTDSIPANGEVIVIFDAPYDETGSQIEYTGGTFNLTGGGTFEGYADIMKLIAPPAIPADAQNFTQAQRDVFYSKWFNAMYVVALSKKHVDSFFVAGEILTVPLAKYPYTGIDKFALTPAANGGFDQNSEKDLFNKVNVFPNPLFAFNPATSYDNNNPDDPFVTFSNLPREVTVKIYTLSGLLIRTLSKNDQVPFLRWNLQNEAGLRVASGMYLAIVSSPLYGDKVLKFGVIMPQKQLRNY